MKRLLIGLVCLVLAAGMVTAGGSKEVAEDGTGAVLKVGLLPLSVGVPVQYAADQGWFEEEGLNVQLEYFATGAPVNEAIAAKEIDVAASGFASVYSLANAGCIWLADINTTGGMGVYARPNSPIVAAGNTVPELPAVLGSADTVMGKQILEPLGTAAQYMVESYVDVFGLAPWDVQQVNMEWAPAFQAYQTGEGDLCAMNPPYSYQIEDLGYIEVASFEDVTGVDMMDGLFARGEVVEARPQDITKLVKCIVRAMDDLQDEELRKEYTTKFYDENGVAFSESDLMHEIEDRAYVGRDYMSQDGYKLGEAWVAITDFLVRAEKITSDNAPNVAASINTEIISNATGMDIN